MKQLTYAFTMVIASLVFTACESFFLDEDYSNTALPVLTLEEFKARGYGDPFAPEYPYRLGTASFGTDLYPNHPDKRRELIIYYMAQDARRDFPGATLLIQTRFIDFGPMTTGYGLVVKQPL